MKWLRFTSVAFATLLALFVFGWFWSSSEQTPSNTGWIAPAQGQAKIQGQRLYDMYCASCHGVDLQGQDNWRTRMANGRLPAPPHDVTGHTWHHPDWQLIEMTQIGFVGGVNAPPGYESDMPAFEDVLSNDQIRLILGYIKTSWPDDALAAQREISQETNNGMAH